MYQPVLSVVKRPLNFEGLWGFFSNFLLPNCREKKIYCPKSWEKIIWSSIFNEIFGVNFEKKLIFSYKKNKLILVSRGGKIWLGKNVIEWWVLYLKNVVNFSRAFQLSIFCIIQNVYLVLSDVNCHRTHKHILNIAAIFFYFYFFI